MKILIIDGQGGKIGSQLAQTIIKSHPEWELTAVGTNAIATSNMLRAGAQRAATGENAVAVACRSADVILGPMGIVIADSLYGEVTPRMAEAVARSEAKRILIPFSKCDTLIAGLADAPLSYLMEDALLKLDGLCAERV